MSNTNTGNSLIVWGRRNSFNVQKVLWLIGELNLQYKYIPAGGSYGGLATPEFLAMNPHGHVPVIKNQDTIVWESHTILRYLAAIYGDAVFWHADPAVRASIEGWMDWQQTTLQPDFLSGIFWGYYRTPESQRDWTAINESMVRCARHFKLLDGVLARKKFLCGSELSLADITVGTALYRYFELDLEKPDIPHVVAWYHRLKERPAYCEYVMVPFDDLYGRLTF